MEKGSRLREERQRLNMTQPEMAKIGGFSVGSIVGWEKGTINPNVKFLDEIAKVGVDIQYILTGNRSGGNNVNCFSPPSQMVGYPEVGAEDVFSVLYEVEEYLSENDLKLTPKKKVSVVRMVCIASINRQRGKNPQDKAYNNIIKEVVNLAV